jgi:hypothetical protein
MKARSAYHVRFSLLPQISPPVCAAQPDFTAGRERLYRAMERGLARQVPTIVTANAAVAV